MRLPGLVLARTFASLFLSREPKARVATTGQEKSPKVTFHAPGSVGECEGMNPHTPKGTPTLGARVPVDSQIFREQLQGPKPI